MKDKNIESESKNRSFSLNGGGKPNRGLKPLKPSNKSNGKRKKRDSDSK